MTVECVNLRTLCHGRNAGMVIHREMCLTGKRDMPRRLGNPERQRRQEETED